MKKRILSAIIGIAILLLVFIPNIPVVVNIAVTIVSCIGLYEFYKAFKSKGYRPFEIVGYITSLRNIRNRIFRKRYSKNYFIYCTSSYSFRAFLQVYYYKYEI